MRRMICLIISISILLSMTGCHKDKEDEIYDEENLRVKIKYDNTEYLILDEEEKFNYYINNEFMESFPKSNNIKALKLPITSKNKDVTEEKEIVNRVYESNLNISAQYINLLKDEGYTIEFEAYTDKFIEIYLRKQEENEYTRLIITNTYIVVSNTTEIPEFNIKNYLH